MRTANLAAMPKANARGNRVVSFTSPDNRIENITLAGEDFDRVVLRFDFNEFKADDTAYTFDLIQRADDGTVIGGETFVIESPRLASKGVDITQTINDNGTVELAVADDAGFESFSWSDSMGDEFSDANTVSVSPTIDNNRYTLHAFTPDGEVTTASATLEPMRGIKTASPIGNTLAVTLRAAAETNSRLIVTSLLTNTEVTTVPLTAGMSKARIDLSNLPQGTYAVTYAVDGEVVESTKFTY